MANAVILEDVERVCSEMLLNGTVTRGQPIAYDGSTGWVRADASDATTNLYAQFIAMDGGIAGEYIMGCKGCTLFDLDAPYTADGTYYLSATAGEITTTRPTTAADVIQILGRGVDSYRVRIDITPPHEVEVMIPPNTYDVTNEAGLGVADTGWSGPAFDSSAAEIAYFTGRFPSGVLSVAAARVIYNSIGETTATVGAGITVGPDSNTNNWDTGTAHSAAAPTSIADNVMCYSDVTAMFDAGALKAGANFSVKLTSGGTFTGDLQVIGLYIRYLCV